MKVIYEPKGRAKEYADLACNNYIGCPHACKYCFAPNVMRSQRDEYHLTVKPRTEAIKKFFEDDCKHLRDTGDTRRVHMNFVSDPYPELEKELHLTRYCIETAAKYGVGINILTKGMYDTVCADFNLMRDANVHFGVTCAFIDDDKRLEWEPKASDVADRFMMLKEAHESGIFTWVSMEPVVIPEQALEFFCEASRFVDLWKVGKLNYHPHEKEVDWVLFRERFIDLADKVKAKYIIKKDLLEAK